MNIELVKVINGKEDIYKYLPLKYCCEKMRLNPMLKLTDHRNDDSKVFCFECEEGRWNPFLPVEACKTCGCNSKDESDLPRMKMIRSVCDEDDFSETEYVSIDYCPHCGEKINISVVAEADLSHFTDDTYEKLEELRREYDQCDSISKRNDLYKKIKRLSDIYDSLFEFGKIDLKLKDENGKEIELHGSIRG